MAPKVCQMRHVAFSVPCKFGSLDSPLFLNFVWISGGRTNERDFEQGQPEFNIQFILVGR